VQRLTPVVKDLQRLRRVAREIDAVHVVLLGQRLWLSSPAARRNVARELSEHRVHKLVAIGERDTNVRSTASLAAERVSSILGRFAIWCR
jgi:hypothetical protein